MDRGGTSLSASLVRSSLLVLFLSHPSSTSLNSITSPVASIVCQSELVHLPCRISHLLLYPRPHHYFSSYPLSSFIPNSHLPSLFFSHLFKPFSLAPSSPSFHSSHPLSSPCCFSSPSTSHFLTFPVNLLSFPTSPFFHSFLS